MSKQSATSRRLLHPGELLRYTWPPLLASVGSIAVGLTDSLLVAHYSTPALAGVSLGAALYELPINALLSGLMAYRILAPRLRSNNAGYRETAGLRIMLGRLLPIAAFLAAVIAACSVIGYFSTDNAMWSDALTYSAARSPSLVFEIASSAMAVTLVVWGRTRIPLLVFAISAPANLIFDFFFVYGIALAPELGALGAGIGSTLSTVLPVPILLALIAKYRTRQRTDHTVLSTYAGWPKLAWPAVGSAVVDYGGNIVFTLLLSSAGAATLAGMRFGVQLHLLAFIAISSASSGALYILGQTYAENPDHIRRGAPQVRQMFCVIGFIVGATILLTGLAVSPILSPDHTVGDAFRLSIVIVSVLCPIAGLTYGNVTLLRLYGLTNREFAGNAMGVWVAQIPVALILSLIVGGIFPFIGLAAYWILRCTISHVQVREYVLRQGTGAG
ncbi:MATE family efflux transporter [Devriesea agamarum]|uniref:MATE family efflux transporter n=1 Tax=Devriesea agamarum TaxID=472569 RepID=UPI00071D11BA|nr:MATE family efflux transporter [Devriesea agamarum]